MGDSIKGGNSDNGEIAAKWGNFGTYFGHFCPLASLQKVEIVITAKLLQNGGLSLNIEGGNSDNGEIAAKWGTFSKYRRWK